MYYPSLCLGIGALLAVIKRKSVYELTSTYALSHCFEDVQIATSNFNMAITAKI